MSSASPSSSPSPAPESSAPAEAEASAAAAAVVKEMSNPSSEVSIEELGAEEDLVNCDKADNAEEIITDDSKGPRDDNKTAEDKHEEDEKKDEVKEEEVVKKEAEPVEEISTAGAEEIARIVAKEERVILGDSDDEDWDDEDWDDETLLERLVGLTEMFPEGLRQGSCALVSGSITSIKWAYKKSRNLSWLVCSSVAILFLPIMIESERMGIEEAQKQQQRQILLGPGAAVSGGAKGGPPPMPQM